MFIRLENETRSVVINTNHIVLITEDMIYTTLLDGDGRNIQIKLCKQSREHLDNLLVKQVWDASNENVIKTSCNLDLL